MRTGILNIKCIIVLILCCLSFSSLSAQVAKRTGKVTDINGEPLIGVAVTIKGTTIGTTTDLDGKFELDVEKGKLLTFSYIGMEPINLVVKSNIINVTMKDSAIALEEVVAVGYGVQKKIDLTGSVTQIKGERLQTASTPNLRQNIAGKLTGVQVAQYSGTPGFEESNLLIRGRATTNNSSPLVLVDGVSRSWDKLDPNDIASMTVLKDAASTAVYGARAANGVIIITTKRGNEGKATVEYTGSFGIQQATKMYDLLNAYDYARYFNQSKINQNDGKSEGLALFSDDAIEKYRNGTLGSTDWIDATLNKNSSTTNHSVSISGGTKGVKYFMSAGYLDQNGYYNQSWFKRYNTRSNIDADINKYINVTMDLSMSSDEANRSPITEDNMWTKLVHSAPTSPSNLPSNLEGYAKPSNNESPIGYAEGAGYENVKWNRIETTFKVNVKVPWVKGLSLMGRYSMDKRFKHEKTFEKNFKQYLFNPELDEWSEIPNNLEDKLTERKTDYTTEMGQLSATYTRSFGNHNVDALFLFERESGNDNWIEASRKGFMSQNIDYIFAGNTDQSANDGKASKNTREGYVGRINYNYASKYYLQLNARYDGSYKFARNSRFGFFPSISVAYRISEENFMKDIEWISHLKLRASYGILGNDNLAAFQYLGLYSLSSDKGYIVGNSYMAAAQPGVAANKDVTWEKTKSYNIGLDFSVFNNMLTLEFDCFKKNTTDMLITSVANVPESSGLTLPKVNLGEAESKGLEFTLRYNTNIGKAILSLEPNLTYAVDKLVYVGEPETINPNRRTEGKSINQTFGYKSAGLFSSLEEIAAWPCDQDGQKNKTIRPGDIKYVDISGADGKPDGKLTDDDMIAIGKPTTPQLIFGFNANASYNNFSLTANFQGAALSSRKSLQQAPFLLDANTVYEVVENSWTESNQNSKYPRLVYAGAPNNTKVSDFWMEDASYVRLKNIELSYSFPKKIISKLQLSNLRIFVAATNLLTISSISYQDPEIYNSKGHFGYAPPMKSYSTGLSVSF